MSKRVSKRVSKSTPIDLTEHTLARSVSQLSREIHPENDLWTGVVTAVKKLPQEDDFESSKNKWMPLAFAASLLIAAISLGFTGYTLFTIQQNTPQLTTQQSAVDLMEETYANAKSSYLLVYAANKQTMSAEVRRVLEKNLKIIGAATEEIRGALKLNPNNQYLTEALLMTHQKEIQLLNQVLGQQPDAI